jgi:hypothetical protein
MICQFRLLVLSGSIIISLSTCYQEKPSSVPNQLTSQKDSLELSTTKLIAPLYYEMPYLYTTTAGKTTAITLKENHTYTISTYGTLQNDTANEEQGRWEVKGRTLQLRDQLNALTTYSIGERYLQIHTLKKGNEEDSLIRYALTN